MLILLRGRHRNLLNLSLGLAVATVIPQTCIYKQNNSNVIYFGREMPRAAWHCCICSFLLTKGELFVLVWLHCKKKLYYIIKMQRQPLKKMDQKSGKTVLVHKNDSTVLRPKLKQGRFFLILFFWFILPFSQQVLWYAHYRAAVIIIILLHLLKLSVTAYMTSEINCGKCSTEIFPRHQNVFQVKMRR